MQRREENDSSNKKGRDRVKTTIIEITVVIAIHLWNHSGHRDKPIFIKSEKHTERTVLLKDLKF